MTLEKSNEINALATSSAPAKAPFKVLLHVYETAHNVDSSPLSTKKYPTPSDDLRIAKGNGGSGR
ncbi:hypothetical protein MPLSOD_340137 [Mesorhizobium sp. SOD10]|nr:hypothetical protein MPLSOD_340137 [Mesorhizobium sp. SOD10]